MMTLPNVITLLKDIIIPILPATHLQSDQATTQGQLCGITVSNRLNRGHQHLQAPSIENIAQPAAYDPHPHCRFRSSYVDIGLVPNVGSVEIRLRRMGYR